MIIRWRHPLALLFVVFAALLTAAPTTAAPPPTADRPITHRAEAAAACTGTTGVTVVVDFTALGGEVEVGCAPGDPASGLAALSDAGFVPTGTLRWGMAFVCRIDGLPTPAVEPCVDTPSATGYWSYWHASAGGDWTYSSVGAGSYDPAPGSVEGWAFGMGSPPSITAP